MRGCALLRTARKASPVGLQLSASTGWPSEGVSSLSSTAAAAGQDVSTGNMCQAAAACRVTSHSHHHRSGACNPAHRRPGVASSPDLVHSCTKHPNHTFPSPEAAEVTLHAGKVKHAYSVVKAACHKPGARRVNIQTCHSPALALQATPAHQHHIQPEPTVPMHGSKHISCSNPISLLVQVFASCQTAGLPTAHCTAQIMPCWQVGAGAQEHQHPPNQHVVQPPLGSRCNPSRLCWRRADLLVPLWSLLGNDQPITGFERPVGLSS